MSMDPYIQRRRAGGHSATTGNYGFTKTVVVAPTDNGTVVIRAAAIHSTSHKIRVQRISVVVRVGVASKTWTISTSTVTFPPGAMDVSVAGTVYTFDFGPNGIPSAANEALNLVISAAGSAGIVTVEGFESVN